MSKELKFEDMSMTDFIRMAKKNGYEVQVNEVVDCEPKDKKLAIECLKEVKKQIVLGTTIFWADRDINKKILQEFSFEIHQIIKEIIDNKIKELEGNKNAN